MKPMTATASKMFIPFPGEGDEHAAAVSSASIIKSLNKKLPEPDPEVKPKPARRLFSAEYKLKILQQTDQCHEPGQIGELLRKEGLYSSHLTQWRKLRQQGILDGLSERRGKKQQDRNQLIQENQALKRKNLQLEKKMEHLELLVEVQKKISDVFQISTPNLPSGKHGGAK